MGSSSQSCDFQSHGIDLGVWTCFEIRLHNFYLFSFFVVLLPKLHILTRHNMFLYEALDFRFMFQFTATTGQDTLQSGFKRKADTWRTQLYCWQHDGTAYTTDAAAVKHGETELRLRRRSRF